MLDKEVTDLLDKPLDPNRVKHRAGGGGMSLAYLKGHNVIDQANDIFGFGAWGYDILMVELVNISGDGGEVVGGYYAARVRLTVAGCVPITEEGVCPIQEGRNPRAKIDAHDMARKGAVTDAMKRAFRCYGDQFGNSLYDTDLIDGQPGTEKAPANQNRPAPQQQPRQITPQPQQQPAIRPTPTTTKEAVKEIQHIHATVPVTQATPIKVDVKPQPEAQPEPKVGESEISKITILGGQKGLDEIQIKRMSFDLYGRPLDKLDLSEGRHLYKVLLGK